VSVLERILASAHGIPCWRVRWDSQIGLDLAFGRPSLLVREPPNSSRRRPVPPRYLPRRSVTLKAPHEFWITYARWRVVLPDGRSASGSSSQKAQDIALHHLEGQKISRISIRPGTGTTVFEFDLGARLEVRRRPPFSEGEIWMYYKPNGFVLSIRGDGRFTYHQGKSRARKRWRPLPPAGGAV
jgi:hypothetical protein